MPKQDAQIQRKVEHLFLAEKYFTDELLLILMVLGYYIMPYLN
jgi:hypothetical protein